MTNGERHESWTNWSGLLAARPAARLAPGDIGELCEAVRTAPGPLRAVGTSHSFTPLVQNDGTLVSLDRFAGLIDHDPAAMTARVGAGTKLGELARAMHAVGQAFPNMGDIDRQAFGGALATATHGSGAALGAYHTGVEALTLVDGTGKVRDFSVAKNADDLLAVCPGLGAFGMVTQVTIRNVAPYRLHRRRTSLPIRALIDDFPALMSAHRSAEFFYIPFSRMALFITSDLTDSAPTPRPPDEDDAAVVMLGRVQRFTGWLPPLRRALLQRAVASAAREDYVADWLAVYPSQRNVRFNEMEYHLPIEEAPKALAEVIERLETRFPGIYFPIEVRTVAADEAWLSPFYRRPSASIAVHHTAGLDHRPYFSAMEEIFRRHGGRPHWGKMHSLTAKELKGLYPRFRDAMAVRRDLDPDNRFVSPYMARLFGVER